MPAPSSAASPRPFSFTPEQQHALVTAAGQFVAMAVTGQGADLPRDILLPIATLPVHGAFVSLKRRGKLRSCCGFLAERAGLLEAIARAAERSANDDPRFPALSPTELPHLELELWLLDESVPIDVQGDARIDAVEIGKHGLRIAHGERRGLLLPGVAVDHNLSATEFLEHVCHKAGLGRSAWRDDQTSLWTFEGHVVKGLLSDVLAAPPLSKHPPVQLAELQPLAEFCHQNLKAMLAGATPIYGAIGLADADVHGVVATVLNADGDELTQASRVSLKQTVPLQSTLQALADHLTVALRQTGITQQQLGACRVSLAVVSDPALHGTVAEPDLRGFDPTTRLLLVKERNKGVSLFDPNPSADELLSEAARLARVDTPEHAAVMSLQTVSQHSPLVISNLPQAARGPDIRPAAQAGRFYPANPAALDRLVDQCLEGEPVHLITWPAAMVPHAGLVYSGRIASNVLRRIKFPSTIIVLGPKHTPHGTEWAVAPHLQWSIPGHTIGSDPQLARRLSQAIPGLELDAAAHTQEHAIEVELPFLARLAPQSRVVGIALGGANWRRCQQFATGLAQVIRELPEQPLLLISSDMNHFATDAENRRLDEIALQAMESLDPHHLLATVTRERISMCGVVPATIVLESLRQLGQLTRIERAGYATSADVSGDQSRVVGYAGMLIT